MRAAAWPILFAVAYLLAGRLGYLLVDRPGGSAAFWPPNGLYLAALLLAPRRRWPAFLAAAAAASLASSLIYGRPAGVAILYFLGNTAEVVAAALLVPLAAGGRPRAGSVRGLSALLLVPALAGLVVSAAVRLAAPRAGGAAPDLGYWIWWAGSALGTALVAPLVLAWRDPRERLPLAGLGRRLELAAVGAAHLGAVALLASSAPGAFYATELLLAPPMLWAAIRFGPRAAAVSALAMAAAVVLGAAGGRGLAARPGAAPGEALLATQFTLTVLAATVLLAGAAASERKRTSGRRARAERRRRDALRAARLWRFASEKATDALVMVDRAGTVLYANEALARLLGLPPAAAQGRPAWGLWPSGDEAEWRAWFEEAKARGRAVREQWIPVAGGEPALHEVVATWVTTGGVEYLVQTMRDLSDRRKAEAAVRLAGVGTLAAGVAHEINNPLSWVAANVDLAREAVRRLADRPGDAREVAAEAQQALVDAAAGAARVRDIVRDLKVFSRDEAAVGPVDVRQALQAALGMARNEIRHRARLVTSLEAPVPPVLANEQRLGQVFLNLLVNAAQAIREGQAEANEIAVAARAEGDDVVVEVRDTGAGMGPQVRARLFEPFFTTKPLGEGTGLGLSVCHGIVSALGGRIEVSSREGLGSTFRVILPPAPPEAAPTTPPPSPAAAERPALPARVLVVDDEPLVGVLARRLLPRHQVTAVEDAREALERAARGERWEVILCDVMMPELSGPAFHARLEAGWPDLARRVLLVTGGAFTAEARAFLERFPGRRLEKPFAGSALREAVDELVRTLGRAEA